MGMEAGQIGTFTIANGATGLSGAQQVSAWDWLGFKMPTTWIAAGLQVEFSDLAAPTVADADWWVWATGAADVALVVSANRYVTTQNLGLYLPIFTSRMWMRLRSGTRAAPVNQTASRAIDVYGRRLT